MTEPLAAGLLDPAAYPHPRPSHVELAETHISWVFLAGDFVYKVKKPVDFDFLDFTTLGRRLHFCQEEVRLNRRLAPEAYLGVVPIVFQEGRFMLEPPTSPGKTHEPVDYAVRMRRLPAARMMTPLVALGAVTQGMLRQVAEMLAAFHREADIVYHDPFGGAEGARQATEENFAQTEAYIGTTISRARFAALQRYCDDFLARDGNRLNERRIRGTVRDCHGDLHCGAVCFTDPPTIFDCIEFNQDFRFIDVANEVAFLAMDLDFRGRHDLGRAFLGAYCTAASDLGVGDLLAHGSPESRTLDFFLAYRAFVRGKVAGFLLDDPGVSQEARDAAAATAAGYFDLAWSYTRPTRPRLILTMGVMGTGKSTLAEALAHRIGADVYRSDVLRKELAGVAPDERRWESWDTGIYDPAMTERTYAGLLERAEASLASARPVVLDGSYRKASWRAPALALAKRLGAEAWIVETTCPDAVILERLREREAASRSVSDGRTEILETQRREFEAVATREGARHLIVDTAGAPTQALDRALEALGETALTA